MRSRIYQRGALQIREIPKIPEQLRRAYLSALPEPQEYYVENLVLAGQRMHIAPQLRAQVTLAEFVDDHGDEDDRAENDVLRIRFDTEQIHHVVEHAD